MLAEIDLSATPAIMKPTAEGCKYGVYKELNPGTHMLVMEQAEAGQTSYWHFGHALILDSGLLCH